MQTSPKPISLLSMMSAEDRAKARANFQKRIAGETPNHREKVPAVAMIMAEAGVMFGWQAVVDLKRGYTEGGIPLTLEEMTLIIEGGRKVQYGMNVNAARGTQVAVSSALSKTPKKTFERGMEREIKEAKN